MTERDPQQPTAAPILERLQRLMSTATVYGEPVECDGVTVIPAARVIAGGGGGSGADEGEHRHGDGGGAGLIARPAGAFIVADGRVTWKPAITLETVAVFALMAAAWLGRRSRGRRTDRRQVRTHAA
ncbi:MAG: sporulation protein [Acidimicrobiia bacterium]|nr:sporulation protein [Acidimicrobiia bacterium]